MGNTQKYENGDEYTGELKNGIRHGKGIYKWKNGDVYNGYFENGGRNGSGYMKYNNGHKYDGEWKNDKLHGHGLEKFSSGAMYEGQYVNGIWDGMGIYKWRNGDIYKGNWKKGKCHGKGIYIAINGDMYDGEYENGKRNGKGIAKYADGGSYDGDWKDGKKHGRGLLTFANGINYNGQFTNGKQNGTGIATYLNGDCYQGEWRNGKKDGHGVFKYKDGSLFVGMWKQGKRLKPQAKTGVISVTNRSDDSKSDEEPESSSYDVLVLLIGISKYSDAKLPDLPGVRIDMNNYSNLWKNDYYYDVLPAEGTKWFGKDAWTYDEIIDFVEKARKKLYDDKEERLVYDGLIFIFAGHGGDGCVYSSDGKEMNITDLHSKFSGAWKSSVTKIPRVFICDCCRGTQHSNPVQRGNMAHRSDKTVTLYGNSPGNLVSDNKEKGGYFTRCVVDCLRKNKYNKKHTLTKLAIAVKKDLCVKTGYKQLCWKEGDPECDEHVFIPKFPQL